MEGCDRFEKIKKILCCPDCHSDLRDDITSLFCNRCDKNYQVIDETVFFIFPLEIEDETDKLKTWFRSIAGKHYRKISDIISPGFPVFKEKELEKLFSPTKQTIVDLGSGSQRLDKDIICVDFINYKPVDIICDIAALPFKSGTVDGFMTWGVLEHVPEPEKVVDEMYRCTKIGGSGIHSIPFLYHFHASPCDFRRYTHKGLEILFKKWNILKISNASGPASYFNLGIVEFLSSLFSFGSSKMKSKLYILFCAVTFPLKILDLPFIGRESFSGIAPLLLVKVSRNGEL